jgi:hypothetical protein
MTSLVGLLEIFGGRVRTSFRRGSHCSYITWRMNNRPVGGRSSETCSHPIDMMMMIIIIMIIIFNALRVN